MQNSGDSGQISIGSYEVRENTNDSFIHTDPLKTSSQQVDLADRINGLYRLLDLHIDDSSNGIVDKIIISKEGLRKLCIDTDSSSFKSISEINYTKLDSVSFRLIGCYGNRILIAKFLLRNNTIDQQLYDLLTASVSTDDTDKPSLRPGIYLLKVNPNLGLIIHWPEIGCYESDLNDSSQIKRNMVNLHRYLTKLTDHQMCFMSDEDLKSLNLGNSGTKLSKYDDDSDDEYEVTKTNEEKEDFNIYDGFKVNLPNKIKAEINNQMEDNIPLYPIVVESTTNQSFVTRQLIKGTLYSNNITSDFSSVQFQNDLKVKLQDRYLRIDRNKMDMNALELFVIHGLGMEKEFLIPLRNAMTDAKNQNEIKMQAIAEDVKIIQKMALIKLRDFESYFSKYITQDNPLLQMDIVSDTDLQRIKTRYPGIDDQIEKMAKIESKNWNQLKVKYNLTCIVIKNILEKTNETGENKVEMKNPAIETFYSMFTDEEADLKKLLSKYANQTQQSKSKLAAAWNALKNALATDITSILNYIFEPLNIARAKQETYDKSNEAFIQELVEYELFKGYDDIKKKIINKFIKEYRKWEDEDFTENLQILTSTQNNNQLDKLKREYEEEKKRIENNMFEKIRNEIESKYKDGSMGLYVLNVERNRESFKIEYNIEELRSDQLQLTIYETSTKVDDNFQVQENESHIPLPILLDRYDTSFLIDPQVYEFRKISQFDNRKFLLVLYNKTMLKIEIFFDTAQQLAKNFKSQSIIKPFKVLNSNENFIIAMNEPKGLLAIYNTKDVKLDVFSFDDNRSKLYGYGANIQLLQWYNNDIPNIKYFLFIKDTKKEELCFVEDCGRARIFDLSYLQFKSVDCEFPSKLVNVLSSPDGSCIVAFAKEILEDESVEADSIASIDNNEQRDYNNSIREIYRVYVYFSEKFGGSVSKVIDLPLEFKFLEFLQISCINNRQTHLISLDLENGCFNSLLVKITLQKDQFRFQKCMHNQPLALHRTNDLINVYKLMFEKYPIDSCINPEQSHPLSLKVVLDIDENNIIEKYGKEFEKYIDEMFENLKRSTNKPAHILKKFSTSVMTFQELYIKNAEFQKFSSEYQLGEWIIKLCCLIPIHIAVARNNLFQPLKDGLSSNECYLIEPEYDIRHVEKISKNISFGWYEGIFKHFGNKKVKVVSSMGEQSCGKSFMLNHLVGTTFDGSAMRCTEGVWMSLVNTKEFIYVVLDFEGLKSLERTPQEDMFLTLFNTVVSNLILYKNQYTVSRVISGMFQKFQDGAKLFDSDPKIFQARLCIIIKDVHEKDRRGVKREVELKLNQLVAGEGGENFISKMYKGGLSIIAWPLFNDIAWFEKLSYIKSKLDNQESKYENARTFLQNTKVIMAKLKICDWSSLNESLIQIRVAMLKRLLPIAVSYGMEQRDPIIEPLVNHDSESLIDDPIDFLDNGNPIKLFPGTKDESFIQLFEYLRNYFEKNIQSRKGLHDDDEWFSEFDKFLKDIIKRRTSRVRNWYEQNTAKFPKGNSDIIDGRYALNQKIEELTRLWTLCGLTCHKCSLKCIKNHDHKENHACLTDHKCHYPCHFTEAHDDCSIPECRYKAGHKGKHACDKIIHLCNEPCILIYKLNCQKVCSKEIGHDDGEHLCQSKRNHYCGKDCSLSTRTTKGDYRCSNKCTIPYEEEHDLHRCENKICPIQCPIPSCRERCQSDDHFHALSKVDHFCGNEHHCQKLCEYDGICHIAIEPKKQEETYKGKVRGTSITYTKYIQVSEKSRCIKKIPPNKFEHVGKHTHTEEKDAFHFCDKKCQFCEYYCTLPYGHSQIIHDTKHGNMSQTEFTGEDDEFEYSKYNLSVCDQGIFVLCNLFCKELGRHRHIDYCKNVENCEHGDQGRDIEHIKANISPNPDKPKDFISHKLFWERTCFKDPYTVQEQEEFTKCDYECPGEEHRKTGFTGDHPTKSFCKSKLFHAKLCQTKLKNDNGYISFDGHHFGCKNPYTAYHIIFVLDRSYSMSDEDIKPNPNFPIYNDLTKKHNNRIGAVYQAVYIFMNTHKNCAKRNMLDNISLILFDQEVIVPFEYKDLTDLEDLLNSMLQHESYGGTSYNNAIQKAGSLIETYFDPTKVNVIIFLSDGECGTPTNQLHDICKRNKEKGSPLYLYTILFGSDSKSDSLEEMATIAQSYHPQNSSSGTLRCQFTNAINANKLVDHFNCVEKSLREHKPSLLLKKV